jgi:hypothetical protein
MAQNILYYVRNQNLQQMKYEPITFRIDLGSPARSMSGFES